MDSNSVIIANEAVVSNFVDFAIPLVAALFGGVIAGGFTLLGVILTHNKDLEKQKQNQSNILKNFYQAIHTEVETIWQGYMSGLGLKLEKLSDDQPLDFSFTFTTDAFPVYKANLYMVGQIPDTELRTLIIRTYAHGQGIIDSTVSNNSSVSNKNQWDWMYFKTQDQFYKDRLDAEIKGMVDYAKNMKVQHNEIKKDVIELLEKLNTILCDE